MINIIVNSDSRYPVNKLVVQTTVLDILRKNNIAGNVELGISIVGNRKMHQINRQYRGIDAPTNIITFALEDPPSTEQLQHIPRIGFVKSPDDVLRLGDILLAYPQVVQDAATYGHSVEEELVFLIDHGVKHLLGLHHD